MYGSDSLGGCIVKQLVRDASLAVAAAGPLLLHGNVLFNVTPRDPRPVIGDQNRTD
jgi:hypothetical protein